MSIGVQIIFEKGAKFLQQKSPDEMIVPLI